MRFANCLLDGYFDAGADGRSGPEYEAVLVSLQQDGAIALVWFTVSCFMLTRIYGGTSEVMKTIIAKDLGL